MFQIFDVDSYLDAIYQLVGKINDLINSTMPLDHTSARGISSPICNPSYRFLKEFNLSTLSTSKSLMNGEAGVVFTTMLACLALEAIMKDKVEQLNTIGAAATKKQRSRERPESARLCVNICKYGS